jgi:accessory colonization factor AcfC
MTEPAQITITINGTTAAIQEAIQSLAAAMGGDKIEAVALSTDGTEAKVKAKAKPRAKTSISEATADADILAIASEGLAADAAAKVDTSNVVQDMTPAQAREAGIKEIQDFFSANPHAMPIITKLTDKFGVKYFKDITDDRAHEFYADVKLVVAGSADAA